MTIDKRRRPGGQTVPPRVVTTPARRLVEAFPKNDPDFDEQAERVIHYARYAILSHALDVIAAEHGDEQALEFTARIDTVATVVDEAEGDGTCEVLLVPVVHRGGDPMPDAEAAVAALEGCGGFSPGAKMRFLSGWRRLEDVNAMDAISWRRALDIMVAGDIVVDELPEAADEPDGQGVLVRVGILTEPDDPAFDLPDDQAGWEAEDRIVDGRAAAVAEWAKRTPLPGAFARLPACRVSYLVDNVRAAFEELGLDIEEYYEEPTQWADDPDEDI